MSRNVVIVGLLGVLAALAWTLAASSLFLFVAGLWGQIADPLVRATAWWRYAFSPFAAERSVKLMLAGCAVVAAAPFILAVVIYLRSFRFGQVGGLRRSPFGVPRAIERGTTDNHGHAAWATPRAVLGRFGRPHGCLIGALDRSPDSPLLFDSNTEGAGHCMSIAGIRGDKSTTAVARVYYWRGPRVVFDPSCELGPIMTPALVADGYNVTAIGLGTGSLNIVEWIDVQDPLADTHVRSVVDWIYDEAAAQSADTQRSHDPYWSQQGRLLVVCLLAHVLFEPDPQLPKNMVTLCRMLALPEAVMETLLCGIRVSSHSEMARNIAGRLSGMEAKQTFSGIRSNASAATDWLSVSTYAGVVSGDAVRPTDILDASTVLFVQIPLRTLRVTPGVGRAVTGALLNAVFQADGNVREKILFEIDECRVLGPMKEIMLAHTTGGKYRILMHTIWQSEAQLDDVWGVNGARELRDCLAWRSYNAVQDGRVAEQLSHDLGEHGVMAWSEGTNTGMQRRQFAWFGSKSAGDNVSAHEIKRRLILAAEILRAPADEMYVLARDFSWPIKCCTSPYWRYPSTANRMAKNRFSHVT